MAVEITSEDRPEDRARDDVAPPVLGRREPLRAFQFSSLGHPREGLHAGPRQVERGAPHMNLAVVTGGVLRRGASRSGPDGSQLSLVEARAQLLGQDVNVHGDAREVGAGDGENPHVAGHLPPAHRRIAGEAGRALS